MLEMMTDSLALWSSNAPRKGKLLAASIVGRPGGGGEGRGWCKLAI